MRRGPRRRGRRGGKRGRRSGGNTVEEYSEDITLKYDIDFSEAVNPIFARVLDRDGYVVEAVGSARAALDAVLPSYHATPPAVVRGGAP